MSKKRKNDYCCLTSCSPCQNVPENAPPGKLFRTTGQKASQIYSSLPPAKIYPLQGTTSNISGIAATVGCVITIEETVVIQPPLDLLMFSFGSAEESGQEGS